MELTDEHQYRKPSSAGFGVSTLGGELHPRQRACRGCEAGKQRVEIVFSPDQREGQTQSQIGNGQESDALGTSPLRSSTDERHTKSAHYQAENGRFIERFLNDVRRP